MSLSTEDVRRTVLEQGKVALDEARKPWLAAVGATDLAYGQLREQLKELPVELRKLQSVPGQLDPAQLRQTVEAARGAARDAGRAYATAARDTYETLAHRGDLVVRRIRRRPEVRETFEAAEEVLSEAHDAVAKAEEKVTRPTGTTRKPATHTAPARTAPARTAAARTAPARKAAAKRTAKS
jgi:hypothetical protein